MDMDIFDIGPFGGFDFNCDGHVDLVEHEMTYEDDWEKENNENSLFGDDEDEDDYDEFDY